MRQAIIGERHAVLRWCRDNDINPRDKNRVVLVSVSDQLRGLTGPLHPVWVGPNLSAEAMRRITEALAYINATAPKENA